jgi:hypothetical protein
MKTKTVDHPEKKIAFEGAYITNKILFVWTSQFLDSVKQSKGKNILELLVASLIHAKNSDTLGLSLPEQTIHRLQPLDISCCKSLSYYYTDEVGEIIAS